MYGDGIKTSREFEDKPSISGRLGLIEYMLYENTTGVTSSQRRNLSIVENEYNIMREVLDKAIDALNSIESKLDALGIPYTINKGKDWKEE
jgi:hypothetical protein